MRDRELLELAARAAGIDLEFMGDAPARSFGDGWMTSWNPLSDDGDALRLAVKLALEIAVIDDEQTEVSQELGYEKVFIEPHDDDPYAATRRAIVRCAAEIGKEMK